MGDLSLKPVSDTPFIDEDGDREEIVEAIKDWFSENFEDPAQSTPYDGGEGGYQWVWGGPFSAREEIEDAFFTLDQEILDEAISAIEEDGDEWAPSQDRITEDYDPQDERVAPYDRLQSAISDLEKLLAEATPLSAAIGGNFPPEDIGLPPYNETDHAAVSSALEVLKADEVSLSHKPEAVEAAAAAIKSTGEKIKNFLARHGDKFAESFASQMGKRVADSLTLGFWWKLSGALLAVYEAATYYFPHAI